MNQNDFSQHPDPQSEREKYVLAFNDTMLKIWQEQITLLNVIDTGRLLHSVSALPVRAYRDRLVTGLPRIRTLAGLRYRKRNPQRQ